MYLLSALELPDSPDKRRLRDFKAGKYSSSVVYSFVQIFFLCRSFLLEVFAPHVRCRIGSIFTHRKMWCCFVFFRHGNIGLCGGT